MTKCYDIPHEALHALSLARTALTYPLALSHSDYLRCIQLGNAHETGAGLFAVCKIDEAMALLREEDDE